ncbi:crotonase/enoyl-CoA hydratase family protein [Bosea sp. RAC05]|uniref:crotonase/enoyl-CoA hydratase family protein n=1 Tax=Bosea sp. RAC05 TaxID=1842539 RepID=UPI00083DA66B|nr:crotonase/enoyl-CoA hydratase family protein [Bosea sp. RAC05]AOG03344.1 enoyl-CoA hydratase/isomerase family protein [Bosea sp. RAC05]
MEFRVDYTPNDPAAFPAWEFKVLRSRYLASAKALYVYLDADGVPSFTPGVMNDLLNLGDSVRALYEAGRGDDLRYVVVGSAIPGMFNMGGDLGYFSEAIMTQNRRELYAYARHAIRIIHDIWAGFGHPVVTIALVEGDALGGGFEAAIAHNFVLSERNVRLGLPEVTFNLFPGMGATTFLTRRLGGALAEEIIFRGKPYSGEEMEQLGVVDFLAEDGKGSETLDAILSNDADATYRRLLADRDNRQARWQVSYEELRRVVDIWAGGCFGALDADVRHMQKIVGHQKRRIQAA